MTHQGSSILDAMLALVPSELIVSRILTEDGRITIQADPREASAWCPVCQRRSHRVHSRYDRRLADLPWQRRAVAIAVTVRRFRCDNARCERKIFVEQLSKVMTAYSRRSRRLAEFSGISGWRLVVPQAVGWPIVLPCQSAGTHCSDWSVGAHLFSRRQRPRSSVSTTSLGTVASATAPSSATSSVVAPSISRRIVILPPLRRGWRAIPASTLSLAIGAPVMVMPWRVRARRRAKSPTVGI